MSGISSILRSKWYPFSAFKGFLIIQCTHLLCILSIRLTCTVQCIILAINIWGVKCDRVVDFPKNLECSSANTDLTYLTNTFIQFFVIGLGLTVSLIDFKYLYIHNCELDDIWSFTFLHLFCDGGCSQEMILLWIWWVGWDFLVFKVAWYNAISALNQIGSLSEWIYSRG